MWLKKGLGKQKEKVFLNTTEIVVVTGNNSEQTSEGCMVSSQCGIEPWQGALFSVERGLLGLDLPGL